MDEDEYLKLLSQKILDLRMKRGMTQVPWLKRWEHFTVRLHVSKVE